MCTTKMYRGGRQVGKTSCLLTTQYGDRFKCHVASRFHKPSTQSDPSLRPALPVRSSLFSRPSAGFRHQVKEEVLSFLKKEGSSTARCYPECSRLSRSGCI